MYHGLNRDNARARIFRKPDDYAAFERVLAEAQQQGPPRLPGYCLMPNPWHLAETAAELAALRGSVNPGRPYGKQSWCADVIARLALTHTIRPRGDPRKTKKAADPAMGGSRGSL